MNTEDGARPELGPILWSEDVNEIIASVRQLKIDAPVQLMRNLDELLSRTPLVLRNKETFALISDLLSEVIASEKYSLMCEQWARKIQKDLPKRILPQPAPSL